LTPARAGLLERLSLHRPELRAWAAYDWANSAVWTSVIATIFPIYFARVAAAGMPAARSTALFAFATTAGMLIVAFVTPVLGITADRAAVRKRMLATLMIAGAAATAALFFVRRGDWKLALVLFVLIELGVNGSCVFYDSLLPHLARGGEMDRLSTTGYALGYLGGGILLSLNLAWIRWPQHFGLPTGALGGDGSGTLPARIAFLSAAVWWVIFSIPLLRRVPEPPPTGWDAKVFHGGGAVRAAVDTLRQMLAELRCYPQAMLMLVAMLIYSDGIGTLIRMATMFGAEVGIRSNVLIGSFLIVQFVGVPFALLFGRLAGVVGPKGAILIGLAGYAAIAVFAFFLRTATHFVILAFGVAVVQGGTQALGRSLFASLIPKQQSASFFSLFAVTERFAGILGPLVFATVSFATGSSRGAILSVVAFFLMGATVLARVDVAAGRSAADAVASRVPVEA
jgi:UMF1 family MFS transporter